MTQSDAALRQEIDDELAGDMRIDGATVAAAVRGRVVTLVGKVATFEMKLAAAEAAHRVPGVLDVANELIVVPADAARADGNLACAIRRALRSCDGPDDAIASTVFDGFVVLEGEIDSYAHKQAAAAAVRAVPGVVAVDDRLTLHRAAAERIPRS